MMVRCAWQVRHLRPVLLSFLLSRSRPFVASQVNALVILEDCKSEQILIDQYLHNLAQSCVPLSLEVWLPPFFRSIFNNLVSVRFQKFNNIPPEKLFSVVLTCFHFNFYSTLLLNFYSGFSNVTPSDWQVLLWCVTSFLLIMWNLL